jgi:hypothetical protein
MKFWLAAVVLALTSAAAQQSSREYLIRLPSTDFPARLRAQGITPLQHEGGLWVVRASDERILRQSTEEVVPAASVTIELQPGANISQAIVDAGGLVTRSYRSVSAITAFLPTSKIEEIQKLPDVKRVHKSRAYQAFEADHE